MLTSKRTISFPQSPSIMKYYPQYLSLIVYLVLKLKLYLLCSQVAVHTDPKILNIDGPHCLSCL